MNIATVVRASRYVGKTTTAETARYAKVKCATPDASRIPAAPISFRVSTRSAAIPAKTQPLAGPTLPAMLSTTRFCALASSLWSEIQLSAARTQHSHVRRTMTAAKDRLAMDKSAERRVATTRTAYRTNDAFVELVALSAAPTLSAAKTLFVKTEFVRRDVAPTTLVPITNRVSTRNAAIHVHCRASAVRALNATSSTTEFSAAAVKAPLEILSLDAPAPSSAATTTANAMIRNNSV